MTQEIFVVNACIIDANGTFNNVSGYPKTFKSVSYDNDIEKTRQRAIGDWHEVMGGFAKRDDRQVQYANVIAMSNGAVVETGMYGGLPELPEPNVEG